MQMETGFLQRRLLERKPSPEGQCYTEELQDIVQLLLTRELQLRELAEAAGQLLEDYEVAETQLEGKPEKAKSVFGHSRQLNTNFVSAQ